MIYLEESAFPGTGDTFVYFASRDDIDKDSFIKKLDKITAGTLKAQMARHEFAGKENTSMLLHTVKPYHQILLWGIGKRKDLTPARLRDFQANAVRQAAAAKAESVSFFLPAGLKDGPYDLGKELALGFCLGQYRFDKYKHEENRKNKRVADLHILSEKTPEIRMKEGVSFGETLARSVVLARDLVNEPASHMYPEKLAETATAIQDISGGKVKVQVLDRDESEKIGMGAYLGVAQGSDRPPKFIVLEYIPPEKKGKAKTICLVGKSITFDSGGISIKPSSGMEEMKSDMAGGAAVLGVFDVLARTGFSTDHVWGILPACENMPSGKAIKPGDIVKALNGKTAEVVNTDAEGRLTLADAVSYAEKYLKPDEMIDLATLTGACKVALGDDISGLFGNDSGFNRRFLDAAKQAGEDVWELPLYQDYNPLIKSQVADIRNVATSRWGGAITAALFIAYFIKDTKWIHIDIAGPSYITHESRGIVTPGGTGWGVLSITNLLSR